ncbi:MAG: lamin tail domain-containing protein [Actinomycetota bacterium]
MARIAWTPRSWAGAFLALVTAAVLLPGPAEAAPGELFLSEYVEGTSNNRALEVFNGTGEAVDLSAGGYNVQIYTNGGVSPAFLVFLAGTVPAGDVFVLASAFADMAIISRANQLTTAFPFGGDDAVVLRKSGQVIDSIGQVGFDPGTEWGDGLTSTADNTLRRRGSVEWGDQNPWDAFDPALEWEGYPTDTFDGLGWHSACETNPPDLTVTLTPGRLWPANHKMVRVDASVSATDDTDPSPAIELVSVVSSEPGDADDIVVLGRDQFELRAERSGSGAGRVYTVTYRATDACGNSAQEWAIVFVPHDFGG